MPDKLEKFIKKLYRRWKKDQPRPKEHPLEEDLACFLEGRLSTQESEQIQAHLVVCDLCMEIIATCLELESSPERPVPQVLRERLKGALGIVPKVALLEIYLKLKEKILEVVHTSGDVLVGQEFMPAPVLRSRRIKDFKDTITIMKSFPDVSVEVKVESKPQNFFSAIVVVKESQSLKVIKDLRVSLIRDNLELESYITDTGRAVFEQVMLGKYTIEISQPDQKVASVLLEIRQ